MQPCDLTPAALWEGWRGWPWRARPALTRGLSRLSAATAVEPAVIVQPDDWRLMWSVDSGWSKHLVIGFFLVGPGWAPAWGAKVVFRDGRQQVGGKPHDIWVWKEGGRHRIWKPGGGKVTPRVLVAGLSIKPSIAPWLLLSTLSPAGSYRPTLLWLVSLKYFSPWLFPQHCRRLTSKMMSPGSGKVRSTKDPLNNSKQRILRLLSHPTLQLLDIPLLVFFGKGSW